MTKEELIIKYKKIIDSIDKRFERGDVRTMDRISLIERRDQLLLFLEDIKQLSEETRKDFEKVFCEHCGLPIRLPGNGMVTQLCQCNLHE